MQTDLETKSLACPVVNAVLPSARILPFLTAAVFVASSCGSDFQVLAIPTQALVSDLTAADVGSLDLWVLDQLGRDNTPVACAALEAHSVLPSDANVQIVNGPIHVSGTGPVAIKSIADGKQNRVFFVDLYSQANQLGTRVGTGCVGGQTITGGKTVTIDLQITPPPLSAN